jgi:hypothetical protein
LVERQPYGRRARSNSPNNLPVEQATKFKLVLNLKTAKALSLAVVQNVCLWHKADIVTSLRNVRFSNRPFWVKRFQTYPPLQR